MSFFKDKNLYFVGGVVRDELLNIDNFDTDLCYVGNAIDFALENFSSNIVQTNPEFGTVRVLLDNKIIDIASTRIESYPRAGHLPKIEQIGCSLAEDLIRRDFTINAMAKNTLTGEIVDIYGGLMDLQNKKLRVLHDNSFIDDPSRIIRGLKFSVRFGFELEERTKFLQDKYLENINYNISYHRLKKELKETFNLDNIDAYNKFISQKMYKLLAENCVLPNSVDFDKIDKDLLPIENLWLKYLFKFDLTNFEFSKKEKKVLNELNSIVSCS